MVDILNRLAMVVIVMIVDFVCVLIMKYQNNPLNIRHTKHLWNGELLPKNGFCRFSSVVYGIRAGIYLLTKSYSKHGCFTVRQCIERFAPRKENDTDTYLAYVNKYCNIDLFIRDLSDINLFHLIASMCKIESQYCLSVETFFEAKKLL